MVARSLPLLCSFATALAIPSLLAIPGVRAADRNPPRLALPSTGVPDDWLTLAERTGFRKTPRYDDTIAYCRRLADASDWLHYQAVGKSGEGRDLPLMIASRDGAFTPEAARATDKVIVFVQNGIHAGECEGKDASLMLLRDIAITKTREHLLDHVILIVMPIFNVDGHERFSPYSRINQNGPEEMGWRVTARNLNLNRDYTKADAVEMRAWLSVWNAWRPDLHFDNHTTDGGDWQYDLTYGIDTSPAAPPAVVNWLDHTLMPSILPALAADGHVTSPYFWLMDRRDPTKGVRIGTLSPRYSTGYATIRNRPSILVETHMLKPYRTRVICHYNIMRHTLEAINRDPQALRQAVRTADQKTVEMGRHYHPNAEFPLVLKSSDESVPVTFKGFEQRHELSPISGGLWMIYDDTTPVAFETKLYNGTEVARAVAPPLAYVIPRQWADVISVVKAHGLRTERLETSRSLEIESYRFSDVTFPDRPFEGRFRPKFKAERIVETRGFPAGSVVVPLDQPDAKVAIHLLEPDAPDSLVAWGFFNAIFEQKEYAESYVLEALARRMLADDPELRAEFEERIATDRAFAGNARARLYFFYKRSPYWDDRMNLYPVARLVRPFDPRGD